MVAGWIRNAVTVLVCVGVGLFSLEQEGLAASRGVTVKLKTEGGQAISLYKESHALVIGNGEYMKGWDKLPGAVKDVKEVAAALERQGFKVTLKNNLTRDQFNRTFKEFSTRHGKDPDNRLLFYYAGHGHTEKTASDDVNGYLVMVDAPLPEKDEVGFSLAAVDMQTIVTQAKTIRSKHVLFLFDSCFSGTILNFRDRVVPQAVTESVRNPVRQFITAGSAHESVPDRSVFKQAFLDVLEGRDAKPLPGEYLTGEELGFYLKNKIPEYNPGQHPQYGKIRDPKLDKGDFVFVVASRKKEEASVSTAVSAVDVGEDDKRRLDDERERLRQERELLKEMRVLLDEKRKIEEERISLQRERERVSRQDSAARAEAEKWRLEEDGRQQGKNRELAERVRSLDEEKKKLDREKIQFEEQRKLTLLTPAKESAPRAEAIRLRSQGSNSLSSSEMKDVMKRHGFFDAMLNRDGVFVNRLVDNGDGTVTDASTGLVWQKEGSRYALNFNKVDGYIRGLNERRFAGHTDWRLPTAEELASLLRKKGPKDSAYVNPVFDSRQYVCWSSDLVFLVEPPNAGEFWRVSFDEGTVSLIQSCINPCPGSMGGKSGGDFGGDPYNKEYYVRAVRTVK
jgi:hypothetical protein